MKISQASGKAITRSQLIQKLSLIHDELPPETVDEAVREMIELMMSALCTDGRVEIRGFGSFCLHHHDARTARNPKTGQIVNIGKKSVPHFKAGKVLRELVDYE